MAVLNRYLVRRTTGDVWPWAEMLSKRVDVEEVWAETAMEAKVKRALPALGDVSMSQLDAMGKADLMIFSHVRLGQPLDATDTKPIMLARIKEALFSRPIDEPQPAAVMVTRAFTDVTDIKASGAAQHGGDQATVVGKLKPGKGNESTDPDRPLRA